MTAAACFSAALAPEAGLCAAANGLSRRYSSNFRRRVRDHDSSLTPVALSGANGAKQSLLAGKSRGARRPSAGKASSTSRKDRRFTLLTVPSKLSVSGRTLSDRCTLGLGGERRSHERSVAGCRSDRVCASPHHRCPLGVYALGPWRDGFRHGQRTRFSRSGLCAGLESAGVSGR